ncbi:MAG: response regulator [Candidatus Sedimenticola sp. (ex Thyasira tokunagai)]
MMNNRPKKSLAKRVTIGMLLLITLAATFAVAMSYMLGKRDLQLQVDRKLETLGTFLENSLNQPVWNYNINSIKAISEAVTQDEVVAELKVISEDGEVLYDKSASSPPERNSYIKRDIVHDGQIIGSVELGIYLAHFEEPLESRNTWILISFFFEIIILIIITRVLLYKLLKQPIEEVESLTNQFAKGEYQPEEAGITFSEFKSVEVIFRKMGEQILKQIAELERYQEDLEELVSERTGELFEANKSLQQRLDELGETRTVMLSMMEDLDLAKEEAEEATQTKSLFLANMSHEIRTPMNAVLGMLYLAQKTELNKIQRNYLKKTENAAQSLLGIINDILDFSKIEAGKLEVEQAEFVLDNVLEQLVDVVGYRAEEKGLEFLIRHGVDTPYTLIGDSLRVGQILTNLCTNAVKFTERGEIEVSLQSIEKGEKSVQMMFGVRDTGIGLSQEQQGKLFQKFSQVDQTITRKYGGTGLGLSISMKLAELMGGRCWIEQSEPGKGTTFCFTAKFGYAKEAEEHRQQLLEKVLPIVRGLRVLIVDDSAASCEILAEMLKSFNFETETVNSGEEALVHLEVAEEPFDIVLMDWKMPGMKGDQATAAIHQSKRIPLKPKIIMVTAYGREEVMQAAEQVGVEGFLLKPVNPSMLLDAIMSALGKGVLFHEEMGVKAELPALGGARLLLVEDNAINREFAVELLHTMGVEVVEAVDGEVGVEKVKQAAYDAILMDIQMPKMDGLEATRQIRKLSTAKDDRFAKVPIIAMTAQAMTGDREETLEAGMNDYVSKPINPELLAAALSRWVKIPEERQVEEKVVVTRSAGDIASLTYIDTTMGVKRVGGHVDAYLKLLERFRVHYAGAVQPIRTLIGQNKLEEAERQCHALKGVVGNIGADALFKTTMFIDKQLKQNRAPDEGELNQFELQLQQVIEEIASIQPETKAATADEPVIVDKERLLSTLEQLQSVIEEDLAEAESKLNELKQQSAGSEWAEMVGAISTSMDGFDVDGAKLVMQELIERLGK